MLTTQDSLVRVFDQAPDPWWLIDAETSRFLDANEASVEQLGFSRLEISRMGVIDVNRAIPSLEHWHSVTRSMVPGKTARFLAELRRKRGDHVAVEITLARVTLGTDDQAFLAFTRDVSKIAAIEAELRRSRDLWDMAANATGLGIVRMALEGGQLKFDPHASQLHGLPPQSLELSMHDWLAHIHPDDQPAVQAGVREASASREPLVARYRLYTEEGAWPTVELSVRRVAAEGEHGDEIIGTCRDVTEQVSAELLRHDKEAAERANRAKSEFLSRVNHELRTPLNGVLGFAQLIGLDANNPLAKVQRERLEMLQAAGRRLLALINDMLDLARIEREDFSLECAALDGNAVLRNCLALIQPHAGTCDVHLPLPSQEAVWVNGNQRALEQVLTNLLSNAVKYNRRGGNVRTAWRSDGERCCIDVSDEGPGMTTAQQARLFQPFDRLGAERGDVQGSGLGLVIARELVQAMNGDLVVDSAPGAGTRFSVGLPRAACPGDATPTEDPAASGNAAGLCAPDATAYRVLYVEDEPVNVLLMEEIFRLQPHWTLIVASDGAEALQRATQERPDLVLVDMNLPDMHGEQLLEALREISPDAPVPCVALSASALCEQIDRASRAGFVEYWTKPIDVAGVMGGLTRVLAQTASACADEAGQGL